MTWAVTVAFGWVVVGCIEIAKEYERPLYDDPGRCFNAYCDWQDSSPLHKLIVWQPLAADPHTGGRSRRAKGTR